MRVKRDDKHGLLRRHTKGTLESEKYLLGDLRFEGLGVEGVHRHRVIPRHEKGGEGGNEERVRRQQVEVGFEVRWER